jgi:hypothetical protein
MKQNINDNTSKNVFFIITPLNYRVRSTYIVLDNRKKKMLTLAVSHNVFLNEKQRKELINGKTIECIGVSVPVWFHKGTTSEPAVEIFSKYHLTNVKQIYPVSTTKQGYKINLPQVPDDYEKIETEEDEWNEMTEKERLLWGEINKEPDSAENLRDIKDGGNEFLKFKTLDLITKDKWKINVIHYVEIQKKEILESTLS